MVSTVKKSTANRLWRCARMNSRHVIARRLPAGPSPAAPEPRAHRRCADRDAKPLQFADNPWIAPARVLAREPQHQLQAAMPADGLLNYYASRDQSLNGSDRTIGQKGIQIPS